MCFCIYVDLSVSLSLISLTAATQTASMRFQWSVGILCTLVSLGLTIIIVGQRQVLVLLERNDLPVELDKLNTQLSNLNIFKDSVEKLLNQGNKEMKDLDDSMAKLDPVIEGKKGQIDDCQAEKVKSFSFLYTHIFV